MNQLTFADSTDEIPRGFAASLCSSYLWSLVVNRNLSTWTCCAVWPSLCTRQICKPRVNVAIPSSYGCLEVSIHRCIHEPIHISVVSSGHYSLYIIQRYHFSLRWEFPWNLLSKKHIVGYVVVFRMSIKFQSPNKQCCQWRKITTR